MFAETKKKNLPPTAHCLSFGDVQTASGRQIGRLLVLDIKDADCFREGGATSQHGGGNLFAGDPEIMGWLFGQ